LTGLLKGRLVIPHFYTGGRVIGDGLVFADDKEIVLNKTDSSNILESVKILRGLLGNFPRFDFSRFTQQKPQNNFNSPLVVNEITQNNNTPFDVNNSNDNLARFIKRELSAVGGLV
jgi:hypothetical protein